MDAQNQIQWLKFVTREYYPLQYVLIRRGVHAGMQKIMKYAGDLTWSQKGVFVNGRGKVITMYLAVEDMEKNKQTLIQAVKTPRFLPNIFKECHGLSKKLIAVAKELKETEFSIKSNEELDKLFFKFETSFQDLAPYLNLTIQVGLAFSKKLTEVLKEIPKFKKDPNKQLKTVSIISMPDQRTFAEQAEMEILETGLELSREKGSIEERAKELKRKYEWVPVDYTNEPWDKEYFVTALKNVLREGAKKTENKIKSRKEKYENLLQKKKELLESNEIPEKVKKIAQVISKCSYLNDFRKGAYCKLNLYSRRLFREIAERAGVSWDKIMFALPEEIHGFLTKDIPFNKNELLARERHFVILRKGKVETKIYSGKQADIYEQEELKYEIRKEERKDEIIGQPASPGKVTGKAKIVLNIKDVEKVNAGDILVTTMTTVNFISAMRKAAAFITDEGGITCHAAIVSREMDKPCIIGTRNATKILHDNDEVEVDAERGLVNIINKKG